MTNNKLVINNVSCFYDNGKFKAIEDISFSVSAGTISVIIGPSGSGKSTLLRAIAGIEKPSLGNVILNGEELSPKTKKIGFVPQNYGLFPWCTVEENILLGIKIKSKIKNKIDDEIILKMNNLMDSLGILEFSKRYPKELSGGQQQRVSLARAFLLNADVLLMDEPFSALDAITREETQDIFVSLWEKHKLLTVLVTHDVNEALYLGNNIIVMSKNGHILKILDNPFFGNREQTEDKNFMEMQKKTRKLIEQAGTII